MAGWRPGLYTGGMCTCYLPPEQEAIERFWPVGRCYRQCRAEQAFLGGEDPRPPSGGTAPGRERVVSQWGLIRGLNKSVMLADSTCAARFEEISGFKCAPPVDLIEAGLRE
jgi:hypothetical protein